MEVEKMSSVGTSKDGEDDVLFPWYNSFKPNASVEDYSYWSLEEALEALGRCPPVNDNDGDSDSDSPLEAYSCNEFAMYEFKVRKCTHGWSRDWTEFPHGHLGEKARRRDPHKYHYSTVADFRKGKGGIADFRKGKGKKGDACEFERGVFEGWLQYSGRCRTQPCKDGTNFRRRVCLFAHTPDELRVLSSRRPGSAKAWYSFGLDVSSAKELKLRSEPDIEQGRPSEPKVFCAKGLKFHSEADIEQGRPTEPNSGFSLRLSDDNGRDSTVEQQPSDADIELGRANGTEMSNGDDNNNNGTEMSTGPNRGGSSQDGEELIMKMLVNGQSNDYWLRLMMMFLGFNIAHLAFSSLAKAELPSPIAGGLNAFGFYATLIAIILYPKKKEAALILGKIGISATTSGIIVASGLMFLPHNIIPIIFLLCFIVCIVIALA